MEINVEEIINYSGDVEYIKDAKLSKYSTYGTGGKCAVMVFPKDKRQFKKAYELSEKYPVFVLGNGSNVLVSDDGFDGIVINTKKLDKITVRGNLITAECGVPLRKVIDEAEMNSLGGLEFAVNIPASVGGGVSGNCGCFNKTIGEYVSFVEGLDGVYNKANCEFAYRRSIFSNKKPVYSVCFLLKVSECDIIEEKLRKFSSLRAVKQPKGKSCGSVFLNDGYFAGKLIDEAGLKGYTIGDASVSQKHANFIINNGKATSQNIYDLIRYIKDRVYRTSGVLLKEEVKYIGEFNGQHKSDV